MQPVLFTLPGLEWEVQAYGFFIGLALILGWIISLNLARRDHLPADQLGSVYVLSAAVGLFGARGVWLLQHPESFESWRSIFVLQAGTLAPFAGIVLGALVSGVLVTLRKIPVSVWYCAITPAFAVGFVLERVGAFFAGTAYGRYAPDSPLAIRFPSGSPAFIEHRRTLEMLLPAGSNESLPVHPTQIYAVALGLVGLAGVMWLRRRRVFSGQVFLAYAMYFLAVRAFVEEPLRADAPAGVVGPLNSGQIGAAVVLAVLAGVYWARRAKARAEPGSLRLWEGGRWSPRPPKAEPADAGRAKAKKGAHEGSAKAKKGADEGTAKAEKDTGR